MEEIGIKPSIISGTSAGAIAGAFYAGGYAIDDIKKIIEQADFFNLTSILLNKQGLFAMKGFEKLYKTHFPNNQFSDLQIPLVIAATNISKGELVYFSSGNLTQPLMASCCIPFMFQPLYLNGSYFVDGGVLNNFPVEPLVGKCDVIIGSHVNSIKPEVGEINMKDIIDRSFHLAMNTTVKSKINTCDVFIEPPNMSQFGLFDVKRSNEIFEYGYAYAQSLKEKILTNQVQNKAELKAKEDEIATQKIAVDAAKQKIK